MQNKQQAITKQADILKNPSGSVKRMHQTPIERQSPVDNLPPNSSPSKNSTSRLQKRPSSAQKQTTLRKQSSTSQSSAERHKSDGSTSSEKGGRSSKVSDDDGINEDLVVNNIVNQINVEIKSESVKGDQPTKPKPSPSSTSKEEKGTSRSVVNSARSTASRPWSSSTMSTRTKPSTPGSRPQSARISRETG